MAKIIIFTYDVQIDRRELLQCKTLLAHGHEITLYAAPSANDSADPAYVKRLDKLAPSKAPVDAVLSAALKSPKTLYQRALDVKRWLSARYPETLQWFLPVARTIFWRGYVMLQNKQENAFLGMFRDVLAMDLKADLFIAHDLPMLPVAVEAKRRYGGRILYDSHELFAGQDLTIQESRIWRNLEQRYIGTADAVVTVNPSIARELEKRYGLGQVEVIHNAEWVSEGDPVRGRRFHTLLFLSPAARVVLYQGRLSFGRNLETLVRAMVHVADPSIHLVFLGDGPVRDRLLGEISRLGLESRVHVLKAVPQEVLLEYTASADLGVIPYQNTCLNHYYCTPNKLFEFIAAGLPIIATDLPEIARFIGDHQIGLVGDTGNPESLAGMITKAMTPELLAQFRAQQLVARTIINWQQEGERFAAIVARVLASDEKKIAA